VAILEGTLFPFVLFTGLNQAGFFQGLEEFGYVLGGFFGRNGEVLVDGFDDPAGLRLSVDHPPDCRPDFIQGIDGFEIPGLFADGNDDRFPGNLPGDKILALAINQIRKF
jgi:hypothetical protein